MALWRLTPINLDHPRWEAGAYKGTVIVRAPNETAARRAATEKFYMPMDMPVGDLIRLSPWKDDPEDAALVEVTPIEDDLYEGEGPTEVLMSTWADE
jgi:hypothetical protein